MGLEDGFSAYLIIGLELFDRDDCVVGFDTRLAADTGGLSLCFPTHACELFEISTSPCQHTPVSCPYGRELITTNEYEKKYRYRFWHMVVVVASRWELIWVVYNNAWVGHKHPPCEGSVEARPCFFFRASSFMSCCFLVGLVSRTIRPIHPGEGWVCKGWLQNPNARLCHTIPSLVVALEGDDWRLSEWFFLRTSGWEVGWGFALVIAAGFIM